jgi:hypothetical protein
MGIKGKLPKPKPILLGQQIASMEEKYPGFRCKWSSNRMICTGMLKPTDLSRQYTIDVSYSLESPPTVQVITPELITIENKKIPHIYKDGSLCLFYSKNKEWTRQNLISETIIPWTSLWLYYYEIWLATGEWLGNGIDTDENTKLKNKDVELAVPIK